MLTAGKLHLVSRCGTEKAHSGRTTHLHSKVCRISNRQRLKKHSMSTNMKAHNFKRNFKFEPLIIMLLYQYHNFDFSFIFNMWQGKHFLFSSSLLLFQFLFLVGISRLFSSAIFCHIYFRIFVLSTLPMRLDSDKIKFIFKIK